MLRGAALVADAGNDAKPDVADVPPGSDKTIAAILGEIVWLMSQSAEFKQYLISDLEWLVMPPILLRQFRLFYNEGRPVAAVFYAMVNGDTDVRLRSGGTRIESTEWNSGSISTIIATISLVGKEDIFASAVIRAISAGIDDGQ